MDWDHIRRDFRCAELGAYLNTATYGPAPDVAYEEAAKALDGWRTGNGRWPSWEKDADRARELFAAWIGVAPAHVALLPTVSLAAAQVAHSLPAPSAGEKRDNIVVQDVEFRSNLFPWLALEQRGFELRTVASRGLALDDLAAAVDPRTALVAVSSVQSQSGARVDTAALATCCRAAGARLFLDGTQSVGALTTSLDGIDYLACSGYKWLLAPRGGAYLYVAPDHAAELIPIAPGWRAPGDPYRNYYGPPLELAPDMSRCDQSLAWLPWVGARAALEYMSELGPRAVEERDLALAARFRAGLARVGHRPAVDERESSQIVSLHVGDPDAAERALAQERIVAAVRGNALRFSFHFFNDDSDVDSALAALARVPAGA